jgi:uncharacterized membrane protein YfcA
LLVGAGTAAGVVSSVISLASLVSYPALLAAGLPAVQANVTNTVALTFSGLGSAAGSRAELRGLGREVLVLAAAAVVGGLAGAAVLLATPPSTFRSVVPLLIFASGVLLLAQPHLARPPRAVPGDRPRNNRATLLAVAAISVYVGYFGAGGGIAIFAALNTAGRWDTHVTNAVKNVLTGFSNGAASVLFVLSGSVAWDAAVPLAAGFFVGGAIGPLIARRLPPGLFRVLAACAAFALAAKLGAQYYG